MRIGILGTGTLAAALGAVWARAGHEVVIGGRSADKARALAERLGGGARAVPPREAAAARDAVLLAVAWTGAEEMLALAGGPEGTLAGAALIDPTNPVDHGTGMPRTAPGESAAGRIAAAAPGAHVVKAFHLFPADQWTGPGGAPVTVAMCGDDAPALEAAGELVRDAGGVPAVLGGLDRARQLEEVAGFVIGLVFSGHDPATAVPRVTGLSTADAGPGTPRPTVRRAR